MLSALIAPAMVVAISPFSIVAAVVLLLHTDRPRPNGIAFPIGRLAGLAAVTAAFIQAPRLLGGLNRPIQPALLVAIGALLLIGGAWIWIRRESFIQEPRWLQRLNRITPVGAGAIGAFLVLSNPKMLAANAAAGLVIGAAGLGAAGAGLAVAYYSAVASSTVAVPVLAYAVVGGRVDGQLTRVKEWIQRRHAAISAVVLVVVGAAVMVAGLLGA